MYKNDERRPVGAFFSRTKESGIPCPDEDDHRDEAVVPG